MKHLTANRALWMVAFLFTTVYFGMVFKSTLNIPWEDDFAVLQSFLVDFIQTDDLFGKFKLLTGGYGPHRLLLTRLVVLIIYAFSGKLSYTAYIVCVNLFMAGIGWVIWKAVRREKGNGMAGMIVATLLFSGQNLLNSTWAMSGLANVGVVFAAFLTMWLVMGNKINFTPPR
jgi:hypothetical protein